MDTRFILSDYVEQALADAEYDKLEDGTFAGHIPTCTGVVALNRVPAPEPGDFSGGHP